MHIVIVGAGVVGASTAFHLSRMGCQVTIVDAHRDGRATAAGAGIICPWVSGLEDQPFYRLYAAGGDYYPALIAALRDAGETGTGYRRSGAMLVSGDDAELGCIERTAGARAEPAMGRLTRLSTGQAQTLFPPLRPGLGAVHIEGGARVDGRSLAAALLRAAEANGVRVLAAEACLSTTANRVTGVDIGGRRCATDRVPADRVIVTAGAWTDPVLQPLGLNVPVQPQRGQIVHLHLDAMNTEEWPVILPPGSHYIVPFDTGRIVVGATRETGAGFDYRVTAAGQHEVLTEALHIAPGLGAATLLETRIGFRPAATGIRPLFGWMPGIENLVIGTGLGAAGLTIGPYAGRLLAELAMDQQPSLDLAPFDPGIRVTATTREPVVLR